MTGPSLWVMLLVWSLRALCSDLCWTPKPPHSGPAPSPAESSSINPPSTLGQLRQMYCTTGKKEERDLECGQPFHSTPSCFLSFLPWPFPVSSRPWRRSYLGTMRRAQLSRSFWISWGTPSHYRISKGEFRQHLRLRHLVGAKGQLCPGGTLGHFQLRIRCSCTCLNSWRLSGPRNNPE